MNRSWPVHAYLVLCGFLLLTPGAAWPQQDPAALSAAVGGAAEAAARYIPDTPDLPPRMVSLMRTSQMRYLEGSDLLKSGESADARAAFNEAVDMLLQSEWELASTAPLNQFFQELVRRIQQDESRYLQPGAPEDEKGESAVVDELEQLDLYPIVVDPALKEVVEQDLAEGKYDIPIILNDRVLKSMNYWLNRGRKYFHDGLMRSGRYREMIEKVFREASIPRDVMYLAQVESLFKTNALSRAKAKGIWQFGKWTAIRYGLKVNAYIDERSDPEKSTRAAARYLTDLFGMFNDWNLALAAYNWGEGKVQKLVARSGLNDFWDLMDLKRNFPVETQNHVPLIMASIILGSNPERYGFPTELEKPVAYDTVSVKHSIDLRRAASILGITLEQLRELNPALRALSTPPNYPEFELKIPAGSSPDMGEKIAALPAARLKPPPEYASVRSGRHHVRRGETLGQIAARYRVSVASLQKANGLRSAKSLQAGTWIRIPGMSKKVVRSAASRSRPARRVAASKSRSTIKKARPTPKAASGSKVKPRTRTAVSKTRRTPQKAAAASSATRKGSSRQGARASKPGTKSAASAPSKKKTPGYSSKSRRSRPEGGVKAASN